MISYNTDQSIVRSLHIGDFFDGWSKKPDQETLLKSIEQADHVVLAIDDEKNKLIGYITAITDHTLSAYIPFLEVDREYQHQGIGSSLLNKILEKIGHLYMVDLVADKEKAGFYAKAGLKSWNAMIKRNPDAYPPRD